MAKKIKYQDKTRYPKVVDGYEGELKQNYKFLTETMVKDLGKKMVKMSNNKK